jgi:hypothetical protein
MLYIAGLASAANRPLEVLVDGHAFGSISMAAYTLDATGPNEEDTRPSAGLPDPALVPRAAPSPQPSRPNKRLRHRKPPEKLQIS